MFINRYIKLFCHLLKERTDNKWLINILMSGHFVTWCLSQFTLLLFFYLKSTSCSLEIILNVKENYQPLSELNVPPYNPNFALSERPKTLIRGYDPAVPYHTRSA